MLNHTPLSFLLVLALSGAQPIQAQPASSPAASPAKGGRPRTILFVGNSFTQGAHSAVKRFGADTVTDLNHDGYGGVPALFKAFTRQAGLDYAVCLETQGGKTLGFHYEERRGLIDRPWNVVVLQELSTLDRAKPGDTVGYRRYGALLAAMFKRANPAVDVELMATWTRADLTYKTASPWYGQPVAAMAAAMRTAADGVKDATPGIAGVIPVGEAWNRAITTKVADPNPYDGTSFGQVDLWAYDQYHASIFGYYLEALVVFGRITGVDPRSLGATEQAADDLGISPETAVALQVVAQAQLATASK